MCLRAFSKDRFYAWFHFLYFSPICLVLLEFFLSHFHKIHSHPFLPRLLCFHSKNFFFFYVSWEENIVFFVYHWLCSEMFCQSHTPQPHTRFCASSRNVFSTTQNNTVPLKNVLFPKWYLPASRKYQKVLFCACVLFLSPATEELQKEKYSYVDQLPVSEIIHQVRHPSQSMLRKSRYFDVIFSIYLKKKNS